MAKNKICLSERWPKSVTLMTELRPCSWELVGIRPLKPAPVLHRLLRNLFELVYRLTPY